MKKYLVFITILFISLLGFSQNIGVGADVMYNPQTESAGVGTRVCFFPYNRLSVAPELSYYPAVSFNKVSEMNVGLALEFKFIYKKRFNMYAIAHGAYNSWMNYAESPMKGAKPNNLNLECGLGISTNKRLRPFLEYRYNVKFMETHLRLGVLYIFNSNHGGAGSGSHDRRCDAYNN